MNISQLQHFVETVRQGSYAAASRVVFLSAPGISRSVGELEKELDIILIERSGKTVAPTEPGRLLYEKAVAILDSVDDLLELAKALSEEETGKGVYFSGCISYSL